MKKLFYLSALSVILLTSCSKDEPVILTDSEQNVSDVHPLGASNEDPSSYKRVGYYQMPTQKLKSLPTSVDLSGNLPAVGFQTGNSCVGWAVGYYAKTYMEVKEMNWDKNANIYSPMWVYNKLNGGQPNGISISSALSLLVSNGCDLKDNFNTSNYLEQPEQASLLNANHYKAQEWKYLNRNTDELKQVLANNQVFMCGINVTPDFDAISVNNPVYDDFSGNIRGGHALCIVGYDDSKQAFKFVNSWGNWGINGFGWISYNLVTNTAYRFDAYILLDKANVFETETLVGDFNGDKIADIFSANGKGWYMSWSGKSALKKINSSEAVVSKLGLGDFNGDGKADIFNANGNEWLVSYSGTTGWNQINISKAVFPNIKLGDLNGDGKTDVFNGTGSLWYVSWSGTTGWNTINTSSAVASQIDLKDMNGDGKDDVFFPSGTAWLVSYSGTSGWNQIKNSQAVFPNIKVGDLNGDGKADVFNATGTEWLVSWGGTTDWAKINNSAAKASQITLADMNGDGKDDVFYPTTDFWYVSYAGASGWIKL